MPLLVKSILPRLLNVGLQGATLVTRFLLIFFLAKYLEPAEVGHYGLFTAAIGYSIYFIGLDFYTYVTREIVSAKSEDKGRFLKSQASLSLLLYLLFIPIAYFIIIFTLAWPTDLLIWFLPILLLEHFNQEMSRLLIALSEPICATAILFLRQGSWALMAITVMAWSEEARQLSFVMMLWFLGGVAAAAAAVYKIRRLDFSGWRKSVNWAWIRRGLASCTVFMLATLALRGIQTFDRYWLEAIAGIETVGAYILFLGVAGSLLAFLDASVFAFSYPLLIRLHNENMHAASHAIVKKMYFLTAAASAVFSIVAWFLLPPLLNWINKTAYYSAIDFFPWLLAATAFNALGLVPHYALYAQGKDKAIILSHVMALAVFIGSAFMLSQNSGSVAVPQALTIAFFCIFI